MPDSDLARLCRQIYRKHKRALDLIYEYRPDVQEEIRLLLENLIADEPGLTPEYSTKTRIRFIPGAWDSPKLKRGEGWTSSGRMLLAEIENSPNGLSLRIILGPGPQDIRQRFFDVAHGSRWPFSPPSRLAEQYSTLFHRKLLQSQDYEDTTLDVLEARTRERWQHFLRQDLPRMTDVIREQAWLWPDDSVGDSV